VGALLEQRVVLATGAAGDAAGSTFPAANETTDDAPP